MGLDLINVGTDPNDGTGDQLREAFQKVNANTQLLAPAASLRDVADSAFSWSPLQIASMDGVDRVTLKETPIHWALRTTAINTGNVDAVWAGPEGDDATGGSVVLPFRDLGYLLQNSYLTLNRADAARYDPFNLRADTHAVAAGRMRLIEAQGKVRIAHRADDLSGRGGVITFSGLPTAGEAFFVNGYPFIFRASATLANEVPIGASAPVTAINAARVINTNRHRCGCSALADGAIVDVTAREAALVSLAEIATNVATSGCAITATQTVTFSGGVPVAAETVTIAGQILVFRAAALVPGEVTIGGSNTATADNFAAVVNVLSGVLGVRAVSVAGVVTLAAICYGVAGNAITLAEAATNVTVGGATLANGRDAWAAGTGSTMRFKLTPGNKPPVGVLDESRRHYETNDPIPAARVSATRLLTFGGNPSDGDTLTVNGFTVTFKNTVSNPATQIQIGGSAAATATNTAVFINAFSYYFGSSGRDYRGIWACNPTTTTVRMMPVWGELDAAVSTVTKSGTYPTIAAVVTGDSNCEALLFMDVRFGDNAHMYHDAGTDELVLRRHRDNIEHHKSDFRLVTASFTDSENRCFLYGCEVALRGHFVFEGTYVYLYEYGGARTNFYFELRDDLGYTSCFTAGVSGWIEGTGSLVLGTGARVIYSSSDSYHLDTGTLAPRTHLVNSSSFFPGNPYQHPVIDYPNRNCASSHGTGGSVILWGGRFSYAVGPCVVSAGSTAIVCALVSDSLPDGNSYGVYAFDSTATFFVDTVSSFNSDYDAASVLGGELYYYRFAFRSSLTTGGTFSEVPPPVL